jgi:hypothetical protein
MEKIAPLTLTLKSYCTTGIFYIPKFLIVNNYLKIGNKYKIIIEEVKDNGNN